MHTRTFVQRTYVVFDAIFHFIVSTLYFGRATELSIHLIRGVPYTLRRLCLRSKAGLLRIMKWSISLV